VHESGWTRAEEGGAAAGGQNSSSNHIDDAPRWCRFRPSKSPHRRSSTIGLVSLGPGSWQLSVFDRVSWRGGKWVGVLVLVDVDVLDVLVVVWAVRPKCVAWKS